MCAMLLNSGLTSPKELKGMNVALIHLPSLMPMPSVPSMSEHLDWHQAGSGGSWTVLRFG